MPQRRAQRRALIIGGSMSGLLAALMLRQNGWQVEVFERAEGGLAGRGAGIVTYIVDRNVNYTNVCNVYCKFCAFMRTERDDDHYVLSPEQIGEKIKELEAIGAACLEFHQALEAPFELLQSHGRDRAYSAPAGRRRQPSGSLAAPPDL